MAKGLYVSVEYAGTDVTADLSPYLAVLTYTDHLDGEQPDTLVVQLADDRRLFQGAMRPVKGSALYFEFGHDRETAFKSGRGFLIDAIEMSGGAGGDTAKWTASANLPASLIHARRSRPWTGTSLKEMAEKVAKEHGLKVAVGDCPDVPLERIDQLGKSDLRLLRGLTRQYGLTLSLKGGEDGLTLVVADAALLLQKPSVWRPIRRDCISFTFRDDMAANPKGRRARYFDPAAKAPVEAASGEKPDDPSSKPPDEGQEDVAVVREALEVFAGKKPPEEYALTGEMTLPGNPALTAGAVMELADDEWLGLGGKWLVTESSHALGADGYTTRITLKGGQ